jgi:hypothetical protein
MKKDIENRNDKGQYHGYQEWYKWNNVIFLRANWKNHNPIGYYENHTFEQTNFYIK